MTSFAIILLAVALYGFVHSLLASLEAKARARQWFGPAADRWYRLAFNLFAGLTLLPVLALAPVLPDRPLYAISFPWLLLTGSLQFLSIVVLAAGVLQTGWCTFVGVCQFVRPTEVETPRLVVTGLYRWVRHPLYTAGLVFIWLLPVMTLNFLALNLGLTLYIVMGAFFEERKLRREFGLPYQEYCQRTPMLLPLPARRAARQP